jgi:TrmH family RNA methyltransferase
VASPELTDPSSARVRRLRSLARRASRQEQGRFLVEGAQAVREALVAVREGRATVHELITAVDAGDRHPELVALAADAGVPVVTAADSVLASLAGTVTPQGLVAVADCIDLPLEAVLKRRPRLVAVLADVRDPGNAGSVIRAADAAGADAVIFAGNTVDPYNGKAVRASVGGIFHLPIVTGVTVTDAVSAVHGARLRVLIADGSGETDLDHLAPRGELAHPTAWVFGNEAWGVPVDVSTLADAAVRIPIYGRAESLNLATAATLCLYASARAQHR